MLCRKNSILLSSCSFDCPRRLVSRISSSGVPGARVNAHCFCGSRHRALLYCTKAVCRSLFAGEEQCICRFFVDHPQVDQAGIHTSTMDLRRHHKCMQNKVAGCIIALVVLSALFYQNLDDLQCVFLNVRHVTMLFVGIPIPQDELRGFNSYRGH